TLGRRLVTQPAASGIENFVVVGVEHWLNGGDLWMAAECRHGAEDDRLTAEHSILLRSTRTGAEAAASGNENGCGAWGIGHGIFKCRCWRRVSAAGLIMRAT